MGDGVGRKGGTGVPLTRGSLRNLQRSTLVNVGCCLCGQRLSDHTSSPHTTVGSLASHPSPSQKGYQGRRLRPPLRQVCVCGEG